MNTYVRKDRVTLGMLYMLGATLLFAVAGALSKDLVTRYSFDEVLFWRSVASLAVVAALILPRTGFGVFRTNKLGAHIGRSGTQAVAQSMLVIALGMLPLAGVVAITFSAPLFATLLAALWLKEKIGLARGTALVIGFLGVLLVAAPDVNSFQMGALFALANAVLLGSVTAAVRGMTKTESTETLTMYQMVILAVVFGLGLPLFGFTWPANSDWLPLLINGVFNGLGQYWWTRSLSMAPPAAVGPFSYFSIVWAALLGFLIWGDVPTIALLAGAAIVCASGLFLLWHESNKKTQPMSAGESLPD